MIWVVYAVILVLCGLLAVISYVERLFTESGKFLTRFSDRVSGLFRPALDRT